MKCGGSAVTCEERVEDCPVALRAASSVSTAHAFMACLWERQPRPEACVRNQCLERCRLGRGGADLQD